MRYALLLLAVVVGCVPPARLGESRAGAVEECRLRFRAAPSVKDSVAVLDERPWCRDVLPASYRPTQKPQPPKE